MPEITDRGASNAINVDGTYHIMVAAIRHRQGQDPKDRIRGRIVNITLVDTFKAHPRDAHYAATKAAVVSLTKGRAHAVAPVGILVNPLALAGMATEKAGQVLPSLRAASQLARAIRLAVARQRGKPPIW